MIVMLFALLLHAVLVLVRNCSCVHLLHLERSDFTHKVVMLFTLLLYAVLVLVLVRTQSCVHPLRSERSDFYVATT